MLRDRSKVISHPRGEVEKSKKKCEDHFIKSHKKCEDEGVGVQIVKKGVRSYLNSSLRHMITINSSTVMFDRMSMKFAIFCKPLKIFGLSRK